MNVPPVISQPPPLPPGKKPFAFQAAQASLFAPLVAIGLSMVANVGMGSQATPLARMIVGSVSSLFILLGFGLGIIALTGVRRHGKKEIFGRAIAGICINGILIALMIVSIPGLMRAAERAKQIQEQQGAEQQPTQP